MACPVDTFASLNNNGSLEFFNCFKVKQIKKKKLKIVNKQ